MLKSNDQQTTEEILPVVVNRDSKVNVVFSHEQPLVDTIQINLFRVFRNMKLKFRVFAWVLILCLLAGICVPLVMYQVSQKPLSVSAVVTLKYTPYLTSTHPVTGEEVRTPVALEGLMAPDGSTLDLSLITSSYTLQNALSSLTLSQPVSVENLKSNIKIEKLLTEDSKRKQEIAADMVDNKNSNAYQALLDLKLEYESQFIVTLTNGFGDTDSKKKLMLFDSELCELLDSVILAYNTYLIETYRTGKLPDDEISIIDTDKLDLLESLDLLRTAMTDLYVYCDGMPDEVKSYRSMKDGLSLNDLMSRLELVKKNNVDYLYSYVYTNSLVKDRSTMVTNYQYQLRNAQTKLDVINENIITVQGILESYKNDEIYISLQESEGSKSTTATTDYYNNLILKQVQNYKSKALLETQIAYLMDKISGLTFTFGSVVKRDEAEQELATTLTTCKAMYQMVYDHMSEIFDKDFYNTYINRTAAQGKQESFLAAFASKAAIGAIVGLAIGCAIWFISALIMEFKGKKGRDEKEPVKEAMQA